MKKFLTYIRNIGKKVSNISALNLRTFPGDIKTTITGVKEDLSDLDNGTHGDRVVVGFHS